MGATKKWLFSSLCFKSPTNSAKSRQEGTWGRQKVVRETGSVWGCKVSQFAVSREASGSRVGVLKGVEPYASYTEITLRLLFVVQEEMKGL